MGITAEFTVGCIGVLIAGATTMELRTTKVLATTFAVGYYLTSSLLQAALPVLRRQIELASCCKTSSASRCRRVSGHHRALAGVRGPDAAAVAAASVPVLLTSVLCANVKLRAEQERRHSDEDKGCRPRALRR